MNMTTQFLSYFQFNGGVLTLGEILKTKFSAEYRKHISLLRDQKHEIKCVRSKVSSSLNTYYLDDAIPKANIPGIPVIYDGEQAIMDIGGARI